MNPLIRNQLTHLSPGAPEGLGPWGSCVPCPVCNPASMFPQGEVGLPGAPGLDGEKVRVCHWQHVMPTFDLLS